MRQSVRDLSVFTLTHTHLHLIFPQMGGDAWQLARVNQQAANQISKSWLHCLSETLETFTTMILTKCSVKALNVGGFTDLFEN